MSTSTKNQSGEQTEDQEFANGPLSLLRDAMMNRKQVLIHCRNNHKLLARVRYVGPRAGVKLQGGGGRVVFWFRGLHAPTPEASRCAVRRARPRCALPAVLRLVLTLARAR